MEGIRVRETKKLQGTISIQGSKNTVLPIIAATLLTRGVSFIYNCPDIHDVHAMRQLLKCLHIETEYNNHILRIDTTYAEYRPLPEELTCKLRSSVLLLGPMLAKWKKAEIGMPGGCEIGKRPIDIHLEGFARMNVDVDACYERIVCKSFHMQGCEYHMKFPSVGATENLIMAAMGATGRTILRGVAREPEVVELCDYLVSLGALIEGIGTDTLIVKGSKLLDSGDYMNVPDRIVTGTYMLMATAIPCDITLVNVGDIRYLKNIINMAEKLGAQITYHKNAISVVTKGQPKSGNYQTGIYPAFPTDLQPILVACLLKANGRSCVEETVFENRFGIAKELMKLGAQIEIQENSLWITGNCLLKGNVVQAMDLRQGAALVVAGMLGEQETIVSNIGYILRGYENIVKDLQCVGVEIEYIR